MVNTVAILGPSGLLGSHLLPVFGRLQAEGKLKLVLIHRPTSILDVKQASVAESRILNMATATEQDIQTALQGVDVLVNALNNISPEANDRLLAALTKSKVRAYIPSDYSVNWNHEEEADSLNLVVYPKVHLENRIKALGIPLVRTRNGLFEPFAFIPPFIGVDVKANTLNLYGDAMNQTLPLVSVPFLAESLGQLIIRDPKEIVGKSFTIIEYETTGQQLADAFEKVHGKKPTINVVTEEEVETTRQKGGPWGGLGTALRRKWSKGDFHADDRFPPLPNGSTRDTFQAVVTALKAAAA